MIPMIFNIDRNILIVLFWFSLRFPLNIALHLSLPSEFMVSTTMVGAMVTASSYPFAMPTITRFFFRIIPAHQLFGTDDL